MTCAVRKLAFVIPWFGSNGGAEAFCAGLARNLTEFGREVEVLTTCCASGFRDWGENHLPAGESVENGCRVRRFPVRRRDASLYAHYSGIIDRGGSISTAQEHTMLENSINSPALCQFIRDHSREYWFFFMPYLYGTTFFGARAAGRDSAFLIPCLHNEPMAYTVAMQEMFARIGGCLFLSEPERDFATTLYDLSGQHLTVIGGAVGTAIRGDARRFRERHNLHDPILLFVGRKVPGKGADLLLKYFERYAPTAPPGLRLVLIGPGTIEIPPPIRSRVVLANAETHQDVLDAMAACDLLVQPSFYESFSLVMMEAWMNERPVLVNGECEVTLFHAMRSHGGLYFTNFGEFAEAVDLLLQAPLLRQQMGAAGQAYVRDHYTWPDTLERFQKFVARADESPPN